jgi:Ca-activated chloride channel family protein
VITNKNSIIIYILLSLLLSIDLYPQKKEEPINRILFVFDASQSMLGRWQSGRKIDIAKQLLTNITDSLKDVKNLELGLRVYGHQRSFPPQDCDDTKLEINFIPSNIFSERIRGKLSMIKAKGTTPIAKSLEEAAADFPIDNSRNIVILITDGKEECGMDPCAVSRLFAKKGIILKPFVIGIGLDKSWQDNLDCVGTFFDAANERDFSNILNVVISHVVDNTTTQVNLLDSLGNPTETDVPLTFYDNFTDIVKYNYIHTMNSMGNPDTMIIDPVLKYKVIAHTIPPVESEIITISPGKHTIIPLKTPQGKLKIMINTKENYQFIVRKTNQKETINVQTINSTQKYITGNYDIELLTLPRQYFNNIRINQNQLTKLQLPSTGLANILLPANGYGGVFLNDGDELVEIYKFNGESNQYKLTLLPGKYTVVYRAKSSKKYIYTDEKTFVIKSGKSQLIKIY